MKITQGGNEVRQLIRGRISVHRVLTNTLRPIIFTPHRIMLTVALCVGLQGCMVFTVSSNHLTNLPRTSPGGEVTSLGVPVAFVVKPLSNQASFTPDAQTIEDKLEVSSWVTVLERYTPRENVFVNYMNPTPLQSFLDAHRGVPTIYLTLTQKPHSTPQALAYTGAEAVNVVSGGLLPIPHSTSVVANFTLAMPGEEDASARKFAYSYRRYEYLTPLFFINPGLADETNFVLAFDCRICAPVSIGHFETTDWRNTEKQRLLAQFLQDVLPLLKQYEQPGRMR